MKMKLKKKQVNSFHYLELILFAVTSSFVTPPKKKKLNSFTSMKMTPSPNAPATFGSPKPREQKIYLTQMTTNVDGIYYTVSLDFGNFYVIKDQLLQPEVPFPLPFHFWSYQHRVEAFNKYLTHQPPEHLMQPYPYCLANGIIEGTDELKINSDHLEDMARNLKRDLSGKIFGGYLIKIHFKKFAVDEEYQQALFALKFWKEQMAQKASSLMRGCILLQEEVENV
jgi:hypothetical protein